MEGKSAISGHQKVAPVKRQTIFRLAFCYMECNAPYTRKSLPLGGPWQVTTDNIIQALLFVYNHVIWRAQ